MIFLREYEASEQILKEEKDTQKARNKQRLPVSFATRHTSQGVKFFSLRDILTHIL